MVELSIQRVPEADEYAVTWKEDGRLNEDKTYYTNDLEDARLTLESVLATARVQGYAVSVRVNRLTGPGTPPFNE